MSDQELMTLVDLARHDAEEVVRLTGWLERLKARLAQRVRDIEKAAPAASTAGLAGLGGDALADALTALRRELAQAARKGAQS